MSPDGNIRCTDYKCGYEGPLSGSDGKGAEFTDPMTGETVDLSKATASSSAKSDEPTTNVEVPQTWTSSEVFAVSALKRRRRTKKSCGLRTWTDR